MTGYAIRGGDEGKRRLELLARVMAPSTEALLQQLGVGGGMSCLDLGCGGGHVSRFLAGLAGPRGRVLGLDIDPVKLDAARAACAAPALTHVEFRVADLAQWHAQAEFDLIYGRFILSHLGERPAMVAKIVDALRPGGLLVLEDVDFTGSFCHPPNAAFSRYCELYRAVIRRRGGDADLGPQLFGLLLGAGLEAVATTVVQPIHAGLEPEKEMSLSTLVNIRDAIVSERLATLDEVEATIAALTAFTHDRYSIISLPRVFQAWGRRLRAPSP